jgi:hypothetical protein
MLNTPPGASQAPNAAANGFNPTNNDPRLIVVDDAMSLTTANITGWNKSDIESTMFKEVGLDRIISSTKEARVAGSKQRMLADLFGSRYAPLKTGGGATPQSIIQPFDLIPRRNRINPGYWRVSTGASLAAWQGQGGNGTTNTAFTGVFNGLMNLSANITAAWVLTVNNGSIDADSSPFAKSPNNVLKNPEKFFLPRTSITAEFNSATGVRNVAQLRIVDTAPGPDANQAYLLVVPQKSFQGDATIQAGTMQPGGGFNTGVFGTLSAATTGWWETTATAAQKAALQPTTGIVQVGANTVSDWESYGNSLVGTNDYGLIEYWNQTHRWTHQYNDEYVRALGAANTSQGLKQFRLLPLAKLRAQQEKANEDSLFNCYFYGDALNELQTIGTWNQLPQVKDPAWTASGQAGSLSLEYLSNTIGIRTQIAAAGNVLDNQGGPLDLDSIFEACYWVKREREGESGAEVTDIDILTDMRFTRAMFRQIMPKYFKAKYGIDNITQFVELGAKILMPDGSTFAEYDSYKIAENGYTLNVFSDQYFDDKCSQFQTGQKSAGRGIWIIDWSDIMIGIIKNLSVTRTNNLADNIYKFVMKQNVQHILLNSRKFQVRVGNCNRHRLIENYSDAAPKITVQGMALSANK